MISEKLSQLMLGLFIIIFITHEITAQSNYASLANSIEYQGDGLPEEATLDGKVCIKGEITSLSTNIIIFYSTELANAIFLNLR